MRSPEAVPTVNNAPLAVDDNFNPPGRFLPIVVAAPGVLANDSDPDGDGLTAALVSSPSHGILTFNANGSFTYSWMPGWAAPDSFTYRVSDGQGFSNLATVTINFFANSPPVAFDDSYVVWQGQSLMVQPPGVLINDTDADWDHLLAHIYRYPEHGSVSFSLHGGFTYTPYPGFVGTDTFTYRADDGTAYRSNEGTVTIEVKGDVQPGQVIISEFRLSGPGLAPIQTAGIALKSDRVPGRIRKPPKNVFSPQENDEFVELYNNTDVPITVSTKDGSAGWALVASDGQTRFIVPNGVKIPARGHFLGVNTGGYSLTAAASGDQVLLPSDLSTLVSGYSLDIPDNSGLALFRTADSSKFTSADRLDAVGSTSETNMLFKEGIGLSPVSSAANLEHSFFRKLCDFVEGAGCSTPGWPKHTDDNAADFLLADSFGTHVAGMQRLGVPGPENLASPIRRDAAMPMVVLDASVSRESPPNRIRDFVSDPASASTFGTLKMRRRVVNNTGAAVTRLRFRVVELTGFPSASPELADLRIRSASTVIVSGINDPGTCGANVPLPCSVTVQGTTLEQPPLQPAAVGGGLNSTMIVNLTQPLANGSSINVQFSVGVEKPGLFRFLVIIEALP